jgi:hypothetical protein
VAPDEGHGFARPVNNMAMFAAAEKFMAKFLGGRYQEGGTEEVVARLKEITVDPKTVVLAKKVDAAAVGVPALAFPLQPGAYQYKANLQMGEQKMALNYSTSIREEDGAWKATDTVTTPMGEMVDSATLDKKTLALLTRTARQGPVSVDLAFQDNKATGNRSMSGQDHAISLDLGGPLFADAAGAPQVIACLPLAEGYSTTFRNLDVMKEKVKLMQLKVAGTESVTVPAGTFDTFKVEITPADGGAGKVTAWIAKESRKAVKVSAVMPEMGGATLTAELQ